MRSRWVDWSPWLAADGAGRGPATSRRAPPGRGGGIPAPDLWLGSAVARQVATTAPTTSFPATLVSSTPLRESLSGFGSEVLARVAATAPEPSTIQPFSRIDPAPGDAFDAPTLVFARGRRRAPAAPPAPPPSSPEPLLQRFLAGHDDPGAPLADEHRGAMEPVIGAALHDVRIHTGPAAAVMARSLQAEAFTIGRSVFFAPGRFEPGTTRGRALLAHELTHVRQQASAGERIQRYGDDPGAAEAEAEQIERMVLASEQPARSGALFVETFERNYHPHDGGQITPADRARLDAISLQALATCEQELGPVLARTAKRVLDSIEVSLTLDLATTSDSQAAADWGRELARAVRARLG